MDYVSATIQRGAQPQHGGGCPLTRALCPRLPGRTDQAVGEDGGGGRNHHRVVPSLVPHPVAGVGSPSFSMPTAGRGETAGPPGYWVACGERPLWLIC